MTQAFHVRFNIHIKEKVDAESIQQLHKALYHAALWATANDPEVFFEEQTSVMGVNVEADSSPLTLIEAGAALGRCEEAYEKSGFQFGPTWFSVHDEHGVLIDAPYAPE